MFIAATRKTGYDIAVHKSQTKTGGRQYGFQRKVKADKKEQGKPFGYSDNSYWLYFTNRGREIDI